LASNSNAAIRDCKNSGKTSDANIMKHAVFVKKTSGAGDGGFSFTRRHPHHSHLHIEYLKFFVHFNYNPKYLLAL
jgi:hypothetical protein